MTDTLTDTLTLTAEPTLPLPAYSRADRQLAAGARLVADLFTEPAAWTQNAAARNQRGEACPPNHPEAVAWCLTGAAVVAADRLDSLWVLVALTDLYAERVRPYLYTDTDGPYAEHGAGRVVQTWNDRRATTYSHVARLVSDITDMTDITEQEGA